MIRETRKGMTRLLVVALASILPVTPRASTAATPSYDPATTVVVFVHGFDPDGFRIEVAHWPGDPSRESATGVG